MADLAIAIKIATEDQSSGPIGKIKSALGGLGEAITAPGRAIGGLMDGLGKLGLAGLGVKTAFEGLKGIGENVFGLGALNELEQTRASFMAFTKDAGKTEELLAGVRKEAALTPFAFGEMAKATASLLPVAKSSGQSIDDLRKQAEILAASNPLEGLEGASFSLREAMTGDFTSIIERFNLSRSTINKLKEEGVPNLEIVRRAMAEMGFDSDLIAAKAETLSGRWSTFQDTLTTLQTRMGQPIFDALKEGLATLQPLLDDNMETFEHLADLVAGGLTQAIAAGKTAIASLVETWNTLSAAFAEGGVLGALQALGPMLASALESLGSTIATTVEGWATAFAAWVDGASTEQSSKLGEMLTALGSWIETAAGAIVAKLAVWAGAFVDWIGPKIPGMLEALGGFLASMLGWVFGTALPKLVEKLAEWGSAFVEWVAPRIPPLLAALADLLLKLGEWMLMTALPAILLQIGKWELAFLEWVGRAAIALIPELVKLGEALVQWIADQANPGSPNNIPVALGKWGGAFIAWVALDVLPKLPGELMKIGAAIGSWIAEKATGIVTEALAIGSGLLQGIRDGVSGALAGFWNWLQVNFVDKIPTFIKNILGIHSPSTVLFDIGVNMVEGLRLGIQSRLPSIEELIAKTFGNISMGGEVDDWLRAAMQYTGAPESWLEPLRWLVAHESSGNPRAKNPKSTASGLFQLIDTTWAGSRDKSLPNDIWNPIINAIAGIRYVRGRYGDPFRAVEFWKANNHYASGGWAGLGGPELAWLGEREPELVVPRSRLGYAAERGGMPSGLAEEIARAIGPIIAATRPQTFIGTTEELKRAVQRENAAEARAHRRLWGLN